MNEQSKNVFLTSFSKERIELIEEIVLLLQPVMNKVHNTNYSVRFWRILLTPYISAAISSRNFIDENLLTNNPSFDVIVNSLRPTFKELLIYKLRYLYKFIINFKNKFKLKSDLKNFNQIGIGFEKLSAFPKEIGIHLSTYYPLIFNKPNRLKRKKLQEIADSYENIFYKNIIRQIPKIFVEYFDFTFNLIPLFNPNNKIFHVLFIESTFIRFLIAKYSENGSKIYIYQHGGDYADYKYFSPYYTEKAIADKFFTWGWRMHENDVPGKAYRLEHFANKIKKLNQKKNIDCLIILNAFTPRNLQENKSKLNFIIGNLNRTKYNKIVIRPRRTSSKMINTNYLKFLDRKNILIDSGYTQISELVSSSSLVIQIRYPSTNALECFYIDHPQVAVLENNDPNDIISEYYKFFLEQRVFHLNVQSLVNFINNTDIENWWAQLIKHPKYLSFKNTFCRKV